jgi:hypothetical protein
MTPNFAVVQVIAPNCRMPRLWLPLFLLWLPAILLSPLILLVVFAAGFVFRISPLRTIAVLWGILCSLPGTDVRVATDDAHVQVKIL